MTKLKPYTVRYRHAGKTYLLDMHAIDEEDAQARLRSAHFNGRIERSIAKWRFW